MPEPAFMAPIKMQNRCILHQGFFVYLALAADIIVSPQAIRKTALMRLMLGFMKSAPFTLKSFLIEPSKICNVFIVRDGEGCDTMSLIHVKESM